MRFQKPMGNSGSRDAAEDMRTVPSAAPPNAVTRSAIKSTIAHAFETINFVDVKLIGLKIDAVFKARDTIFLS